MKVYIAHSKKMNYKDELYIPLRNESFFDNYELVLPHEESDISNNTRNFYKTIDLFIAEVSLAGTGLGIELGWVYDEGTPIYCLYKKGSKLANSLHSVTTNFYEYDNSQQFVDIVKEIVMKEGKKYDYKKI